MTKSARSHLAASIAGGVIVAGGLLAFGTGGRQTTQTIVQQSPVAVMPAAGESSFMTPGAIYDRESPGVVYVTSRLSDPVPSPFDVLRQADSGRLTGSGFLVDRRGDVLTNYHLMTASGGSDGVTVRFRGGIDRSAQLVAADPAEDVAVLKVDLRGVPAVQPLPLGDSTGMRIGDPTLALGDPYGLDQTMTSGTVSGLEHQLVAAGGSVVDNVIQTDVPPDPSASGGPLLNAAGRVIGINSNLIGADGMTVAFATPINSVEATLERAQGGRTSGLVRARRLARPLAEAARDRALHLRQANHP
jgi:S1-C subfamily serine protease